MKIIHTADLHLGFNIFPNESEETRFASLKFLEEYVLSNKPDILLIAGDVFDRRDPPGFIQERFALFVRRITENGTKIFLLTGNHEGPPNKEKRIHLDIYSALQVPGVTVARKIGRFLIDKLNIIGVPYPYRKNLLAKEEYKDKSEEEVALVMSDIIVHAVSEYAERVREENDFPIVVAMHFPISEGEVGSEQYMTFANELYISLSSLDFKDVSYIALGHLHKKQVFSTPRNGIPVVYPGSLDRLNFSEEHDEKGFFEVEISESGEVSMQFVENPNARTFYTVELKDENSISKINWDSVKKGIVRIKILEDFENESVLNETIAKIKKESFVFAGIEDKRGAKERHDFIKTSTVISPKDAVKKYLSEYSKKNRFVEGNLEKIEKTALEILEEARAEAEKS